jgi:hypothetical protein
VPRLPTLSTIARSNSSFFSAAQFFLARSGMSAASTIALQHRLIRLVAAAVSPDLGLVEHFGIDAQRALGAFSSGQ